MNKPFTEVKDQLSQTEGLQMLLDAFWNTGGKEKYEASKEMREINGIPDTQWFKANLMGIIDDAEITYEHGND